MSTKFLERTSSATEINDVYSIFTVIPLIMRVLTFREILRSHFHSDLNLRSHIQKVLAYSTQKTVLILS